MVYVTYMENATRFHRGSSYYPAEKSGICLLLENGWKDLDVDKRELLRTSPCLRCISGAKYTPYFGNISEVLQMVYIIVKTIA